MHQGTAGILKERTSMGHLGCRCGGCIHDTVIPSNVEFMFVPYSTIRAQGGGTLFWDIQAAEGCEALWFCDTCAGFMGHPSAPHPDASGFCDYLSPIDVRALPAEYRTGSPGLQRKRGYCYQDSFSDQIDDMLNSAWRDEHEDDLEDLRDGAWYFGGDDDPDWEDYEHVLTWDILEDMVFHNPATPIGQWWGAVMDDHYLVLYEDDASWTPIGAWTIIYRLDKHVSESPSDLPRCHFANDALSNDEMDIQALRDGRTDAALSKWLRLGMSMDALETLPSDREFQEGRDLWRNHGVIGCVQTQPFGIWRMSVRDGTPHKVREVRVLARKAYAVNVGCDCMDPWEPRLCRHVVAALYALRESTAMRSR